MIEALNKIEKNTNTVEDFIEECLKQDINYEVFFEYLTKYHKG